MNRWISFRQPRWGIRPCPGLRLPGGKARTALAPREGQSLVEFALVVPLIAVLVFAIVAFGLLFEDQIAMNNAARDGVRWATQNPTAWDNSPSAASSSIEGQIQGEGGTVSIPNDNSHIKISYFTVDYTQSPPATTFCGSYDAANNSVDYADGTFESATSFNNSNGCLVPGNLIQVTLTQNFKLPVPIISAFFPGGVTIVSSATMTEEAY